MGAGGAPIKRDLYQLVGTFWTSLGDNFEHEAQLTFASVFPFRLLLEHTRFRALSHSFIRVTTHVPTLRVTEERNTHSPII